MKHTVRRIGITAFVPFLLMLASASYADSLTVPKGTEVPLKFDQALSSKTAKAGDKVMLHVAEDVQVNGKTVIPEGRKVTGIISKVDKRGRYGVNAKLQITFDPVKSAFGPSIPIAPRDKGKFTGSRTDHAALATGGGALVLGPIGLLGGYFVVGKSVQVKVGDKIVTEVSRDVALTSQ